MAIFKKKPEQKQPTSPVPAHGGGEQPFSTILSDFDFYLFGEGKFWKCYEKLGAHRREVDGVAGVNFLVWAPNADSVSVVGNFNGWDGTKNRMHKHYPSGLWETFVPGIGEGEVYKYRVESRLGSVDKADPFGRRAEIPPRTASIVADDDMYRWNDGEWMKNRASDDTFWLHAPVSIYEVHLGSWRRDPSNPQRFLTCRELAEPLINYVKENGYTHIEFLPVAEHPLSKSW